MLRKIWAVFEPEDNIGFVYTVGMRKELFALNVPRDCVHKVAHAMSFLSERRFFANESVQASDIVYDLRAVRGGRKSALMKTHLCQMRPSAVVLELCPRNGWPDV